MSWHLMMQDLVASRPMYRRVPLEKPGAEGFSSAPDGSERLVYAVEVDYTELEALAQKAAKNKSGRAKAGPVRVTITQRQHIRQGGQQ